MMPHPAATASRIGANLRLNKKQLNRGIGGQPMEKKQRLIDTDDLLQTLAAQFGLPAVNTAMKLPRKK